MRSKGKARAESSGCPLCGRKLADRWLRKSSGGISINSVVVCKKCLYGFANRRQFAYVVDWILVTWVIGATVAWCLDVVWEAAASDTANYADALRFTEWVVIPFLFCFKDGYGGVSPGKALMGLRVIDWATREPIGWGTSLKRNLCLMVPFLNYVLAFTLTKGWRAGDGWANTRVVWRKYEFNPPFDQRGFVCLSCGYDLTGNISGRCPECGTETVGVPVSGDMGVSD